MKNLLLLIIIAFAAYGGFTLWKQREPVKPVQVSEATAPEPEPKQPAAVPKKEPTPAPKATKAEPESQIPVVPVKRLAPQGVYYAVQGFSATTDEGVKGVRPGTKVTLIQDKGASLRVADGQQEFEVRREFVTNDLDVVARVFAALNAQQVAARESGTMPTETVPPAPQQTNTDSRSDMEAAQRRLAMPPLLARENALNAEVARIESLISSYQNAAGNLRTKQIYVNSRISGDTHLNEIATLNQKLAAFRAELNNIATRKAELQR